MIIERGIINTHVTRLTPSELGWLQELLTFTQGSGMRATKVCFLKRSKRGLFFGSGFVRSVLSAAKRDQIAVNVEDKRQAPGPVAIRRAPLFTKTPHYYQFEGAEAALKAQTGVIELPTGSGKTLVVAVLAANTVGLRMLYAVSDAVLAAKTRSTIEEETGIAVSNDVSRGDVVCTTLQKLYALLKKDRRRALKLLSRFEILVVDEGHQVPAATFASVCHAVPAFYRIALSATPFSRSDKKSAPLLALFGGLIYRKTEGELEKQGFLPRGIFRMVRFEQPPVFLGKWPEAYVAEVVRSDARNNLIANMAAAAAKPCLVLYQALDHGGPLARKISALGYRVEKIDSRAPESVRTDLLNRLNRGEVDVVVASKIFNVGVDVPELGSVVIAAGYAAVTQTVQRTGRGSRKTATKKTYEVWDVLDWSPSYSKARGAWVARHAHERLRTYRKRGHDVLIGESLSGPWQVAKGVEPPQKTAGKAQGLAAAS